METNSITSDEVERQERILQMQALNCTNGTRSHDGWCSSMWDGILCWASTAPGELAVQQCPSYIAGFDAKSEATKQCMPSGDWYWNSEHNSNWTNYTRCIVGEGVFTIFINMTDDEYKENVSFSEHYLPKIKHMSKAGYVISFFSLVVAFSILASIKRLRCKRNVLHMHLFASFMMRAATFLIKDFLFVKGIGLSTEMLIKDGESYLRLDTVNGNWQCKAFTAVWEYCILANYSWILMEGIYLTRLLYSAVFSDPNASIAVYEIAGWGVPVVVVSIWATARALYEDIYCWTTHKNFIILQLIMMPISLSTLVNLVLFVKIVQIVVVKLQTIALENTLRYKQFLKSTLVLIPLFGVHYSIFLIMSYIKNRTVELVWLFCDQAFASFQGFLVGLLYCFVNSEVHTEITRIMRASPTGLRLLRLFGIGTTRPSNTHSGSTCSCNVSNDKQHQTQQQEHHHHHHHNNHNHHSEHTNLCCLSCCCRRAYHHGHRKSSHSMASTQDIGIETRGGSLASSRGYLEVSGVSGTGNGPNVAMFSANNYLSNGKFGVCRTTHCKNMNQSLVSFCSTQTLEGDQCTELDLEKCEHDDENHQWSDSECCQLAYELDFLRQYHPHKP